MSLVYKVLYKKSVKKDLSKIDKKEQKKILDNIKNILAKSPKTLGKQLQGEFKGFWRYRAGNYRVIYKISEKEILILVLKIGHRKDIYS